MELGYLIEIHGVIYTDQRSRQGGKQWITNLHQATMSSDAFFPTKATAKAEVKLVSGNEDVNALLPSLQGVYVREIKFPMDDVPKQPVCNGDFNRIAGKIDHYKADCPIHPVQNHTHEERSADDE